ncbi:MAG: phosphopantetheine-binding protein [Pseudomonadota bacterium]
MASGEDDLIFQKVCSLLAPLNRANIKLTRETEIVSDMEIDSVEVFDFITEVEDAYDIAIPMEAVSEIKSIGELVDEVRKIKAG